MPETLQTDDYISLRSLKDMLFNFFGFIFKVLEFIITAVRKFLSVFIFCCLLGLVAGYLYYLQSPRYFSTEMIVQSNNLTRKTYYEIVKNLNDLLSSQSYSNFASQLKIDESLGNQVLHVEVVGMNNEMLAKDTVTKTGLPFKIVLKSTSNAKIDLLQNGLLYYLNNNAYIILTKEGQKKIYLERLQFIDKEQRKLDSLKDNYNIALAALKTSSSFYNNALNPADVYVHSSDLADQREKILKWLNNESEGVLLIDGFKTKVNPQSLSWTIPLLIGLGVGVLLGMMLTSLLQIKKAINNG
jgi:hypothetical protein